MRKFHLSSSLPSLRFPIVHLQRAFSHEIILRYGADVLGLEVVALVVGIVSAFGGTAAFLTKHKKDETEKYLGIQWYHSITDIARVRANLATIERGFAVKDCEHFTHLTGQLITHLSITTN